MESVAAFLGGRVVPETALREAAERELAEVFQPATWGLSVDVKTYTGDNYANLWNNEMPKRVRRALDDAGKTLRDYEEWLQEVHYSQVAIYRESLFDHYQDNIGWRILLLSTPAVDASAMGIASHYQGGMAHNRLAMASNALFDIAAAGLEGQGFESPMPGRKVVSADWDGTGLIMNPVVEVAGVNIAGVTGADGLPIKAVRSTTVKKTLASMITVAPFAPSADEPATLGEMLRQLEEVGRRLA